VGVQNQPMRPPALELREMAGFLQDFGGSLPATKGLIAAPWTPAPKELSLGSDPSKDF